MSATWTKMFGVTLLAWLVVAAPAAAKLIADVQNPTVVSFDDGGLVLHYLPNLSGELEASFIGGHDPRSTRPKPKGVQIMDTTLFALDFSPVEGRFRARIGFSGRRIRAGLERLGIRADKLRVLRYQRDGRRWQRVRALRRNNNARALRSGVASAVSGPDALVWATTDQPSGLFAIGALRAIPEPATLSLIGAGSLLLVGVRRRRSAP